MPQKAKKYFLLAASMVFYWLISGKLILFLLITVMAVHHFALWLDRIRAQKDAAVKECEREERKEREKAAAEAKAAKEAEKLALQAAQAEDLTAEEIAAKK